MKTYDKDIIITTKIIKSSSLSQKKEENLEIKREKINNKLKNEWKNQE